MIRRRGGFTFIEMLMVMIVIGLLAGIAVLKYIELRHRALSAQASSDLEAVRLAAYSAWYETGSWPGEAGPGMVPPALAPYLAKNFSFDRGSYTLDWENFVPPGGGPSGGMQLGIVLTSTNPRLQRALERSLGDKFPFFAGSGTLTLIIVGPDGKS